MTWPAFPTSPKFSFGHSESYEPRKNTAKFGDGYSQDVADGINTDESVFDAPFNNLTTAEKDTIVNFLKARQGVERFTVTTPRDGSPRTFVCPSWTARQTDADVWQVTARFERRYDVG